MWLRYRYVRSRRAHLSRSGQLQSLMGTKGRAGLRVVRGWRNRVYARPRLTARRTGGVTGTREIYKFPLKIWHFDSWWPCQFEPDVCADAAACVPAPRRLRADYQSFPSSPEYERPDRIHHTDLGFYRYFASPLYTVYRPRGEYAACLPTIRRTYR